ncbi:MAG: type II toxin-antitoxin system VapC family toxin [Candidatus Bathyarchaeia archaeon]
MPRYVVDASIVAKWVLPGEPYEEQSVRLKEDSVGGVVELHAPSLLPYEVGNLLWRATRLKRIEKGEARSALEALATLRITLHDVNWLFVTECLELSSALDLSVYDTGYIFLSSMLKAPLVTADKQLVVKARTEARALHIKDY